jgi:hypothetical protein
MDQALQRKDEIRLRVLQTIYRMTDGNERRNATIDDGFATRIGTALGEASSAAEFLSREGLLRQAEPEGCYSMTHGGVVEVESTLRDPDEGTKHFRPVVINNVGSYFESAPTAGSSSAASLARTTTDTVHPVIQELREKATALPPEKRDEAESVIDQVENMLERGPRSLKAVTTLIESLVEYWPSAVPWLTFQTQQIARFFGA